MYGEKEHTIAPRLFLVICHGIIIAAIGWFLFVQTPVKLPFGLDASAAPLGRRIIVFAAAAIYFARLCFTVFYLLRRRMGWGEAVGIVVWLALIHCGFAVLAASAPKPLCVWDAIGAAFYLLGSYLNTGSEYARLQWKQKPENQGRLYTEGLFSYSMHINFFGDTLLFTGYTIFTGWLVALIVPALMAILFIFVNIPMLDRYLQSRYGTEFSEYARKTKKFAPFVY